MSHKIKTTKLKNIIILIYFNWKTYNTHKQTFMLINKYAAYHKINIIKNKFIEKLRIKKK